MTRLFNQCPRCGTDLPTKNATSCACGWKKRESLAERPTASPALCAWNDHGDSCGERGIAGPSHAVLYCREHWYRLRGWPGMEGRHGNAPSDPIKTSFAVEEIRKRLKPREGAGPLAKYLPQPAREAGQDDEERAA